MSLSRDDLRGLDSLPQSRGSRGVFWRKRGRDLRYYFSKSRDVSLFLSLFEDGTVTSSELRPFSRPFQGHYFSSLFSKIKDETRRRILTHSSTISRFRLDPREPQPQSGLKFFFRFSSQILASQGRDTNKSHLRKIGQNTKK